MSQPLAIDLYCGLGGWTHGLLAEGYDVVGFDIERHSYGGDEYPAQMPIAKRGVKVGGLDWNGYRRGDPNYRGQAFNTHAERATKNLGGSWFSIAHNTTSGKERNPDGRNDPRPSVRKAASARIAKIPFELASYIARVYRPAIQTNGG